VIPSPLLRRALLVSVALHLATAALAGWLIVPAHTTTAELVDIEIAPPAPLPEALPPEVARPPERDLAHRDEAEPDPASTAPKEPEEGTVDAGVDARPDAAIDAAIDARPDARPDAAPDAPIDAGVPDAMTVASADLDAATGDAGPEVAAADGGEGATQVALADADQGDAGVVARGDGSGSASGSAVALGGDAGAGSGSGADPAGAVARNDGSGSAGSAARSLPGTSAVVPTGSAGAGSDAPGLDTAALAAALATAAPGTPGVPGAPGAPGASDAPAVDGAPTTAGTAANLLSYFPDGHVLTALIRFDRLRGTEWSAQTERLLRPLPDYQLLFGSRDADVTAKLETLVISTPRPRWSRAPSWHGPRCATCSARPRR